MVTECFLTCSWRFLRSNKLEQLEFKSEKIIGIYKSAGKVRKSRIASSEIISGHNKDFPEGSGPTNELVACCGLGHNCGKEAIY